MTGTDRRIKAEDYHAVVSAQLIRILKLMFISGVCHIHALPAAILRHRREAYRQVARVGAHVVDNHPVPEVEV